jgi:hypothetical protein
MEDDSNKVIMSFMPNGEVAYLSFVPVLEHRRVEKDIVAMDKIPKEVIEQILSLKSSQ